MARYRLSDIAKEALLAIARWSDEYHGIKRSNRYWDALKAHFSHLAENQLLYPAVEHNRPELSPECMRGTLRKTRNLGARRIQSELKRLHEISLSLATVHKVLQKHSVEPIKKYRRKTDYLRYACPIPGERVQMDTCKIASGLYQYTAIDDCT